MTRDMTLGEATEILAGPGWACACTGPWPICRCAQVVAEARALRQAAHIVAKQFADLAANARICPRCNSPRWVSVSLDTGWTRRAQCVPCGAIHPGTIGPGWKAEVFW